MGIETKTYDNWQLFIEHSNVPIMICDIDSSAINEVNRCSQKLFGHSNTFLKKSLLTDFLIDSDTDKWKSQIKLFKLNVVNDWEAQLLNKNNEIVSIELKIVDIQEDKNQCLVIPKALITEEKKMDALKKKLSFYETILMQMPTEFAVLDAKWHYLFINHNSIKDPEFREWMVGKTDFDSCSYRNKDFTIAENRHKQYEELARTKTGKEWIDEHLTKEGDTKYVLRQLYPYFVDGELDMNFGFGIDITERINAEKEREKILKEMTIQNEELKQFAYITSHDLKEPLRTISGFTNIIQRKYASHFDEKGLEYLQFVVDSANRMGDLLTGLKSFVTIDFDTVEDQLIETNAQKVLEGSLANLKLKLLETNTLIDIPNSLPVVQGYPQYLSQLFQNLLLNAIKFCKQNPIIKINWEDKGDLIQFSFSDNGIGIDAKYQEKIFNLFNRLDKKSYEGTGMGLAICKKVVLLHKGTMWVESDGVNGSTFFFTLKAKK